MIYLIGGSPRGGKSILSRKLSKALNVPYISTDNLRLVVVPYFKGQERDISFPFIKMFDANMIDEFFQKYTGNDQLVADLQEAKTIWPGVKSLIDWMLVCKMDYIVEGIHLLPKYVEQYKNNKNVKFIFLTKLDEEKIYQGLLKNKNNSDWLLDNTKNQKTIKLAARAMCDYGKFFIKETAKYGFKCLNMEDKFIYKINQAIKYLKS